MSNIDWTDIIAAAATGDVQATAMACAKAGLYVFPVQGRTGKTSNDWKMPAFREVKSWAKESTTDIPTIAAWFPGDQGYGLAIDLAKSNLLVLDNDHPEKFDLPSKWLADAVVWHGNPERASYLFQQPDSPVSPFNPKWGNIKSVGGYVVLPPSPHPIGGRYAFDKGTAQESVPLPDAVEAHLRQELAARVAKQSHLPSSPWTGDLTATPQQIEWATELMDRLVSQLAQVNRGGRNIALNNTALILGHYAPHILNPTEIRARLTEACRINGLLSDGAQPVAASIKSGLTKGMSEPQVPDSVGPHNEAVFEATSLLGQIRQAARSRHIGPWSVLGAVLARVIAELHPNILLPPTVGSKASINLYVALTGDSSASKSTSYEVAGELLYADDYKQVAYEPPPASSGEGLIDAFLSDDKGSKGDEDEMATPQSLAGLKINPNVLLWFDEIGQLDAVTSRASNPLPAIMRSLWSGASAGSLNTKSGGRKRHLPKHTYRFACVAAVQPDLAYVLLRDKGAGGPQRWIWMPAYDRAMPDWDKAPEWPGSLGWRRPEPPVHAKEDYLIKMPEEIKNYIRKQHVDRNRDAYGDGLDGHRNLVRLCVAEAVAALHGQLDITAQWWEIAGMIVDVSTIERQRLIDALTVAALAQHRVRGQGDAEREMAKVERLTDRELQWARLVYNMVAGPRDHNNQSHGQAPCTKRCLAQAIRNHVKHGATVEVALDRAVALGWVEAIEDGRYIVGPTPPES